MASRPGRSLTAVLGIAFGIATVLSVQVVDHNTILTEERRQREVEGDFDVEIKPVRPELPAGGTVPVEIAEDPDLREVCALFVNRVEAQGPALPEEGEAYQVWGVDPVMARDFLAYEVEEGRDLSAQSGREVVLAPRVAAELGATVGTSITLRRATASREVCSGGEWITVGKQPQAGEPQDFTVVGILSFANLGRERLLLVPFEPGLALFAGGHLQPFYRARMVSGAVYQDVRERHKNAYLVEKPEFSLVGERLDQRAFRKSLRFTSTLALLLGLFVIYNSFSMALVERVREIGLLRAMGLSRGEIFRAVLTEGSLLAVAGGIAGLLLTAALVAFMQALNITTLGFGKPLRILEVPWGVTAAIVFLGMLFALLGMAAPLLRARHLSVIDALRAGRLALRSDPGFSLRVALFLGIPTLLPLFYVLATPPLGERQDLVFDVVVKIALVIGGFFVLMLAFPGMLRRMVELLLLPLRRVFPVEVPVCRAAVRGAQQRVLGTLTGLAVVVAAIFCVRAVNQSFLDEMERFTDRSAGGRVFLQTAARMPEERVRRLAEDVEGVERVYSLSAEVLSPFPIRGVRVEDAAVHLPVLESDPALRAGFAAGESLVLSGFLADTFGYEIGDAVNLPTFDGARTLHVGAIADEFGYYPDDRSFALLEAAAMDRLFCVNAAEGSRYVADLTPGSDPPTVARALQEAFAQRSGARVQSCDLLRFRYLLDRRRDFFVFDVILWMVASMACVGLINSLAIAVLERRREIGLLRTLGFTRGQVSLLLVLEALALGCVGGILGTLLTLPLAHYAVEAVRIVSDLDLSFRVSAFAVTAPLATALLIAVTGVIWPALRSRHLDLGALARYE